MAKIERFEDIEAWQDARELTRNIYQFTREFPHQYNLKDQMQRSAVSAMANIAEGFDRGGDAEFLHFLSTAKASCAEVRSHLYVALDAELISRERFDKLYQLADQTGRKIGGFMRYLKSSPLKGPKFKR